jgi:hypothetical protein
MICNTITTEGAGYGLHLSFFATNPISKRPAILERRESVPFRSGILIMGISQDGGQTKALQFLAIPAQRLESS